MNMPRLAAAVAAVAVVGAAVPAVADHADRLTAGRDGAHARTAGPQTWRLVVHLDNGDAIRVSGSRGHVEALERRLFNAAGGPLEVFHDAGTGQPLTNVVVNIHAVSWWTVKPI